MVNIVSRDDIDWKPDGVQYKCLEGILPELMDELLVRIEKHGNGAYNSTHEIYGKTMEEMNEFMDEVRANDDDRAYDELMDVTCAAVWGLLTMKKWRE